MRAVIALAALAACGMIVAGLIMLTGCQSDEYEGTPCNQVGATKYVPDGRKYKCQLVEPTRPQDGSVWHRVTSQ